MPSTAHWERGRPRPHAGLANRWFLNECCIAFDNGKDYTEQAHADVKIVFPVTLRYSPTGLTRNGGDKHISPYTGFLNTASEVEGVKYDRLSILLINALKEQQQQIEIHAELDARQQHQLAQQAELIR